MTHATHPDVRLKALTIVWFARVMILLACAIFVGALVLMHTAPARGDFRGAGAVLGILCVPFGLFLYIGRERESAKPEEQPEHWFVRAFYSACTFVTLMGLIMLFLSIPTLIGDELGGRVGHPYLGAVIGLVVFAALIAMVGWGVRLLDRWRPGHVPCRECQADEYKIMFGGDLNDQEKTLERQYRGWILRCPCGTRYLYSRKRRVFMIVTPGGSVKPYMRYRPLGLWIPA